MCTKVPRLPLRVGPVGVRPWWLLRLKMDYRLHSPGKHGFIAAPVLHVYCVHQSGKHNVECGRREGAKDDHNLGGDGTDCQIWRGDKREVVRGGRKEEGREERAGEGGEKRLEERGEKGGRRKMVRKGRREVVWRGREVVRGWGEGRRLGEGGS